MGEFEARIYKAVRDGLLNMITRFHETRISSELENLTSTNHGLAAEIKDSDGHLETLITEQVAVKRFEDRIKANDPDFFIRQANQNACERDYRIE